MWTPSLSPKQLRQYGCDKRIQFSSGPRFCCAQGTLVWNARGLQPIETVASGDLIPGFGSSGLATQAAQSPSREAVRLRWSAGQEMVVGRNHQVYVSVGGAIGWRTADQMREALAAGVEVSAPASPLWEPVPIDRASPDWLRGYFWGSVIADGCFLNTSATISKPDDDVLDLVCAYATRVGARIHPVLSHGKPMGVRFSHCPPLREEAHRLGLVKTSHEKCIPDEFLRTGGELLAGCVSGIFDGDGWSIHKEIAITSANPVLISQLQQVLARFGVLSVTGSRTARCQTGAEGTYYNLRVLDDSLFQARIGFTVERKKNAVKTEDFCVAYGYPGAICGVVREVCKRNLPSHPREWHQARRYLESSKRGVPREDKLDKVQAEVGPSELDGFKIAKRWVGLESATPEEAELWDFSVVGPDSYYVHGFPQHNSGKTYELEHQVVKHSWHNQGRFGIIALTNRAGSMGIWPALTGKIFQEWKDAGIHSPDAEFEWVKPPYIHPVTKVFGASLRNKFGTASEIFLFPIERVEEAKAKLFSTEFSGLWLSESHLYPTDELFKSARMALRNVVPFEHERLFCDANPPAEGKESWLYKTFYINRLLTPDEFPAYWDEDTRRDVLLMQKDMEVFEYELDDNIFLDPGQKAAVRATYAHDKDDYDRFVLGKWIDIKSPDVVFKQVWVPNIHVVGSAEGPEENWQVLAPSNGSNVVRQGGLPLLAGGWDPGEVNHAWVALQPWRSADDEPGFDILEELLIRKHDDDVVAMPVATMAEKVIELRDGLREFAGFDVTWEDYGDSSSLRARTHATKQDWQAMPGDDEMIDAAIISAVSGGDIRIIGASAVKKPGWQRRRVNFIADLLKANRLRVSAHCKHTIAMFEHLKKASDPRAKTYLDPTQEWKHIFDALSYPICMMCLDHLLDMGSGPAIRRRYAN